VSRVSYFRSDKQRQMKKVIFANKSFYSLLIGFIIVLMLYNIWISIRANNIYGIVPIFIEIVLLILIFTKNQYAKIVIMVWVVIALMIGPGFEIIANLMDDFENNFKIFNIESFIYNIICLAIGILIFDYTKRTISVVYSSPKAETIDDK
jgi:hypothetical protein